MTSNYFWHYITAYTVTIIYVIQSDIALQKQVHMNLSLLPMAKYKPIKNQDTGSFVNTSNIRILLHFIMAIFWLLNLFQIKLGVFSK